MRPARRSCRPGPTLPVRRGTASQFLARLVRAVAPQVGMLQLVEITG